jgi:capsular exopolysaccharide synthesis family protein
VLRGAARDPQYAQAFLQGCMEEYVKLKREMREKTSDTTVAGLTEEVLRLERDLRQTEAELAAFQSTNSVVLLQEQGNSAGNYLAALNQRLAALKSEFDLLTTLTLDQNLDRQQSQLSGTLPGTTSGSNPGNQSDGIELDYFRARQQILVLKAEQTEMGQYLRPKHPKMIAMTEEIARRTRLLDVLKVQSGEQLASKKESLRLQIKNLEKEVAEWDAKNLEISRKTSEYAKMKANQQRVQALYDRLLATMQTLDVNKEISPESVTIMEPATAAFPETPPLLRSLLMAVLVGLALSVAVLLVLDRLDDRMNSFPELKELFDEEVLGQIPHQEPVSRGSKVQVIHTEDERHPFVESYRNLRSSLLYMEQNGAKPKTLLVTSSEPNEGKSMTAANLAITLAFSGARTLLVDADLRRGELHERLGVKSEYGFSDALQNGGDWRRGVKETATQNLSFLPRGKPTARSSELFLNQVTKNFLKEVAAQYDYVVIDTAPVLAADDVTSLAPLAEGTIFVIRAGETSGRVARASLELLYQRRVPVLGLVFNAVRTTSAAYYYYHRYHDYYKPYPSK